MKFDEAFRRGDRLVVGIALEERKGRHHLRLGRPLRIGVLALDLLERVARLAVLAFLEKILCRVVKLLDRPLDIFRRLVAARAGREQQGKAGHGRHQLGALNGYQRIHASRPHG